MSIYAGSVMSFNVANATPQWEIRTNNLVRSSILEIGITTIAATALTLGLGIPAARGTILPGFSYPFIAEDANEGTSSTTICIAWQVAPTAPTNFFRRISNIAGIGSGIIWTFARGLVIPVNGSMVLWNTAANSVLQSWIFSKE